MHMTRSDTESLGDLGAARAVARRRPNPLNMGRGELPCRPIAPILRLSRSCRPTAIAGTIIIMDLYPIERHPGWAQPPVGEEALGSGFSIFAVAPAVANPDASGTIISKCFVAWVRAAPEHCCPRPIFSRWLGPAQAMLEPTRGDLSAAALTTTTLGMTAAQVMRTHNVHRGAIAEASPHHGAAIVVLNSRIATSRPKRAPVISARRITCVRSHPRDARRRRCPSCPNHRRSAARSFRSAAAPGRRSPETKATPRS
jgi:hypothetical protein